MIESMKLTDNPYYQKALEFIRENDLASFENGKYLIDGDALFLNIVDGNMRSAEHAKLEVHDMYIDVQIPLSSSESFGVKPRSECEFPDGEMDVDNDIMFYNDVIDEVINVEKGHIVVFQPDMAHAPLIGNGIVHKAIFKVKVL